MRKSAEILKSPKVNNAMSEFNLVYQMIKTAHNRVYQQVNTTLISLYWSVGQYVSTKMIDGHWGKGTIDALSAYIHERHPSINGFSARNIRRMRLFYETYGIEEIRSTALTTAQPLLLTEKWSSVMTKLDHGLHFIQPPALLVDIPWTQHMHILSKTKSMEEKLYYLELTAKQRYSARDLARLIDTGTYHRTKIADQKLPPALAQYPVDLSGIFKDSYVFEFLNLPDGHSENDLKTGLLSNLRHFLLELGPDFTLMGQEYMLQVGNKDFRVDLLMFHRGLNCMVAIKLKTGEFKPEHLGQLEFYLETLDNDIKKPHENPTVGILICSTKDEEVVKYALNRHMSPTMITDYETKLISKELLQRKIHEISQMLALEGDQNDENR